MGPVPPEATKKNVTDAGSVRRPSSRARGRAEQHPRRSEEKSRRTRVAWVATKIKEAGGTYKEVARRLGISDQTLRAWRGQQKEQAIHWRGRPPKRSNRMDRQALLDDLKANGFHLSVEAMWHRHPRLARREVIDLVRRARAVRARRGRYRRTEKWRRAGAVWALDHTDDVPGEELPRIVVRDLGAKKNLAARAVPDKTLGPVIDALDDLIDEHGPPLVIRADGAFAGKTMQDYLASRGVFRWVTRPGSPWENGSAERANGDLKRRVRGLEEVAPEARRVRDELFEQAIEQSNRRVHPRAFSGRTPEEVWQDRAPIQPDERAEFRRVFKSKLEVESRRLNSETKGRKIEQEENVWER